jgi:hypothetical protein
MSWAALSLVTDQELGQLEPQAVHVDAPWGSTSWPDQRAEAKRDLKIWLEMDFPEVPGVADRVLDRWAPDYVFGYTAAAYTDITSAASDDTVDDVALKTIFTTAATDKLYVGAAWGFEGIAAVLTGTRNAVASVLTVKYSGPAGWATLTASDGTAVSGATFGQSGRIIWTQPTDWQRQRLNGTGDEYFWIELSVSVALTAGVTASQLLGIRPPDGLKRCAAYLTLGHIYNGLAAASPGEERWRMQSDRYFAMAKDLYVGLKAKAGLWIDLNTSGAVSEAEASPQKGGHVFYRA